MRGNHWLVASTIGCVSKVQVFNSIYSDIDKHTRELLLKLFGADMEIEMQNTPKQQGIKDCGVFAIAICTFLAYYGNLPSHITFNQCVMRAHLRTPPFDVSRPIIHLNNHDRCII